MLKSLRPTCPRNPRLRRIGACSAVLTGLLYPGLVTRGLAQTAFLDFNTPDQYTSGFNPWQDNGGANGGNYSFQEGAAAGVSGSGGVSVFQNNDTTATYSQRSWDFSTNGATISVSTLILANALSSGNKAQLGVLNVNN